MSFSNYFDQDDEGVMLHFHAKISVPEIMSNGCGCACALFDTHNNMLFITESVFNKSNHDFKSQYPVIPRINQNQQYKIVLFEMTPTIKQIHEYKQIGDGTLFLGRVLIRGKDLIMLTGATAEITVSAEQEYRGRGVISMIVAFYNMPKNHWLLKNYPQLAICTQNDHGEWYPVFTSDPVKRSETGQWAPISLPCRLICNNDYNKPIRFLVQNAEQDQPVYPIGFKDLTVNMIQASKNTKFSLTPSNPRIARAGYIIIRTATLIERLTFFGHLKAGLRINFSCAIDFASSNKTSRNIQSLHELSVSRKNQYQATMSSIGQAIEPYSDGRKFHAWGFAAKYNGVLSYEFPLKSSDGSDELNGLRDLNNSYRNIVENIKPDMPIRIVPSTIQAIKLVKGKKDPNSYMVHTIMIDDIPVDLDEFMDLLYENQYEPISIVIVGIGEADFTKFEEKCSKGPIRFNTYGAPFEREFFVFLKFSSYGMDSTDLMTSVALYSVQEQALHWVEMNSV